MSNWFTKLLQILTPERGLVLHLPDPPVPSPMPEPTLAIIDLQAEREKRQPHINGKARCLDCRYEWQAVAPVGVTWLECPGCSLLRGRYVYPVREAKQHWICHCGNDLFHMLVDGCYCPNCGVTQKEF